MVLSLLSDRQFAVAGADSAVVGGVQRIAPGTCVQRITAVDPDPSGAGAEQVEDGRELRRAEANRQRSVYLNDFVVNRVRRRLSVLFSTLRSRFVCRRINFVAKVYAADVLHGFPGNDSRNFFSR